MARTPTTKAAREIAESCVAMRLRRLTREVTQLYDDALRKHDLRIGQLTVLVLVDHMGRARPQDIERTLNMERSSVSRTVARIVERGWLESSPSPDDARGKVFSITPKGRALLEAALPDWRRAQAEARALVAELGVEALSDIPATP